MILKSITPQNFGPFVNSTLQIEPEVTVLTGPNDVGKSLALRAIEILCTQNSIENHEVNQNRMGEFSGKWNDDNDIACMASFEVGNGQYEGWGLPREAVPGSTLTIRRKMSANQGVIAEIQTKSARHGSGTPFVKTPSIVKLPLGSEIRQTIKLDNMTDAESHFIRLGFGPAFSLEQHKGLDQVNRSFRIDAAQDRLNGMLRRILPARMPLKFRLLEVAAQPEHLGVALVDEHQGYAPLGSRGTGVRRLLNVMGALLRIDPGSGHTIVLYDEPETSLHADAQHMLRRLLESLASQPTVQVIYTTHSPAMVNTLRPQSLRVLERKRDKEKAISVFINNPIHKNYTIVRSSLGISPADSLLYAPITIIVEGPTEVLCLPMLLKKLAQDEVLPEDILDTLLSQSHLLDGEGSSFEYMCRLAKSQKATPVIFIDGDKQTEITKVKDKYPDVSVVMLPSNTEFEDLVPRARYIQAVAEVLEDVPEGISETAFDDWLTKADLRPSIMFSKRVELWLNDKYDKPLYKSRVMLRAIELTDASEIRKKPIQELFEAMQRAADRL